MVTVFILEKHIRCQFFEYTYKVKLAKFQLPSFRRSAVTNENSLGGQAASPGKIGLKSTKTTVKTTEKSNHTWSAILYVLVYYKTVGVVYRPSCDVITGGKCQFGKATIRRYDLSPRLFCIDATLLCEFESDKIRINEFEQNRSR